MPLDLAPETETTVRQYAEREGISVDELWVRTFPSAKPVAASDTLPRVNTLLRQWQKEYGMPPRPDGKTHTSAAELFAQWDAEDAARTQEAVEAERLRWEESQKHRQGVTI